MARRIAVALFAVLMVVSVVSCDQDMFGSKEPTDISLDKNLMEFDTIGEILGKNLQLTAKAKTKDGKESTDITWLDMPSDTTAFKVVSTSKGVLTFQILKPGTYVVTAGVKYKGQVSMTAQCVITIKDALVSMDICELNRSAFDSRTLPVGEVLDLKVSFTPSSTPQTDIIWSVDNGDVVTVTEQPNGRAIVTARRAGTAVITARSKDNQAISDKVTVIVQETGPDQKLPVRAVVVEPSQASVDVGDSLTLTAKVYDGNSNVMDGGEVKFSISDETKASFTATTGRIATLIATKGGDFTVHASYTSDGTTVTADVPVKVTGDIEGLSTSSSYYNLAVGDKETIDVSYSPENVLEDRKGFDFRIEGTSVQVVSYDKYRMTLEAKSEGVSKVKMWSKVDASIGTEIVVNVKVPTSEADRIQKVTLSSNTIVCYPPYSQTEVSASVWRRADDGSSSIDEGKSVLWSVSDDSVLHLETDESNPNRALVTPLKPGKAVLTARSKDNEQVSSSASITVEGELKALVASTSSVNIAGGGETTIDLTAFPTFAVFSAPIARTSNDNVQASIAKTESGYSLNVKALALSGSTNIDILVDGKTMATVRANVHVSQPVTIRTIELSESNIRIAQDSDPYYISAAAKDSDGKDVETDVLFKAGPGAESVARIESVSNGGFYIYPLNAGSCDWFFYSEEAKSEARLHIEVGAGAIVAQDKVRLKAETDSVTMTKGSSRNVNLNVIPFGAQFDESIVWTIDDSAVAQVTGNGLEATVFALKAGKTIVRAESDSGLKAYVAVNVVEEAKVEDTGVSYVVVTAGGSTTHLIEGELRKSIQLTATAYRADGKAVANEMFDWTVMGTGVQAVSTAGRSNVFSILTKDYTGYDAPATIRATSVSNPEASAVFTVYVVLGSSPAEEEDASILLGYDSITLEKGTEKTVSYVTVPAAYSGVFATKASSDCVAVSLDTNAQEISIRALEAGTSNVTVSDGKVSATLKVKVVEKAGKVDTAITGVKLDRSYLSYDLATKAPQTISATVYRNGIASLGEKVVWSVSDESLVSLTENGSSVLVAHKGTVGTATVTATSVDNPDASASCLVEMVDTTQMAQKLRYVMLSESVVELAKGETTTLTASGQPASLFAQTEVRWSSDDEQVATVSNGKVRAVGVGTATITVTAGGKSDTCRIFVSQNIPASETPRSIRLSETLMMLSQEDMDKVFEVSAVTTSSTGRTIDDRSVVWSVEDPSGALEYSTAYNGFSFSPRNAGTAVVTASMDGVEAQLKIVVGEAYVETETLRSIMVYPSPLVLELGQSTTIPVRATTVPASNDDNLAWAVSTPANVEIQIAEDGRSAVLKGVKAGAGTITVYSLEHPDIKADMKVTVKEGVAEDEVTAVLLDKSSIVLDMAERSLTVVKATVYRNGKASDSKVSWTYSDGAKDAAVVKDMGNNMVALTKQAVGSGYVTATSVDDPTYSASFLVEVIDSTEVAKTKLVGAMLSSTSISIEEGSSYTFETKTIPEGLDVDVVYAVSDESVATIDRNGVLEAKKAGRCTVKAIVSYMEQKTELSCQVYVYAMPAQEEAYASSIRFSKNAVYLSQERMDETMEVEASVYDSSFALLDDAQVVWEIEDPAVAGLQTNGNKATVSPLSAGRTRIKATYRNVSNTVLVVVGAQSQTLVKQTTGVVFESDSIVMQAGEDRTVKASTIPAGLGDKVSYTIDDASVARIQANGDGTILVSALKEGSARLTAVSVQNPAAKAYMTVKVQQTTADVVTGLSLDKSHITLAMDEKSLTELKATVYVDGKVSRTTSVQWSLEGLDETQLSYSPRDSYGSSVLMTKKGVGAGYIVAKAGDVSARCYVEIVAAGAATELADLILSDQRLVLRRGESYTVSASPMPENVSTSISWTTSDNTVAKVNSNGTVSAVAEGNAVVTAHSYKYDVHKDVQIQVLSDPVENTKASFVRLSVQSVELSQTDGKSKDVTASVIATDGFPIAGAVVTWAMDTEGVAEMKVDGNTATLTALDSGRTNIRAYYGSLSASASVYTGIVPGEDSKALDHLSVQPSVLTIQTGSEAQVFVSPYPAGMQISPVWESADTDTAVVKATTGLSADVTGVKQGSTNILVKDKATEKGSTIRVRVRDDISNTITGLTLDRSSLTLDLNEAGAKADVNAKVYVANTFDADEPVKWTFLKEDLSAEQAGTISIVENDAKGRSVSIRPVAKGSGYLRATAENDSEVYSQLYVRVIDSTTIVTERKVTELRLEFESITMKKGSTRRFRAVTLPSDVSADVRWSVEQGDAVSVDIYGNVTANKAGSATVKAYVYGQPTVSDTVVVTVVDEAATPDDPKPSTYDIGSISITPPNAVLSQDAKMPTSFIAKVYDRKGNVLSEENVEWDVSGLGDAAVVSRTEGNTIYLMAKDAGRGTLTAKRTSKDGSIVSKTVDIYTGTLPADPEDPKLEAIAMDSSSPVYIVLGDTKRVNVSYRPNEDSLKGLVWTLKNDTGYVSSTMDDDGIEFKALAVTPRNVEATATTIAKDQSGRSLSKTIQVKTVASKDDLPSVTSLSLDRTAIVLNLASKADVAVTATAFDYEGRKVENAQILWSLEENQGTGVTLTSTRGASTGINKGSSTGTVRLVATCGDVKAYCSIEIVDTSSFGGLSLSADKVYLTVGSTFKITVYGTPSSMFGGAEASKGGDVDAITVTAEPSKKVFSVRADRPGAASIRFTTEVGGRSYSTEAFVYVNDTETLGVNRISLVPSSAYIQVGRTVDFTARMFDRKGNEVYSDVSFSITDPSVASLTTKGSKVTAKGLKAGMATIYAKSGEVEAPAFVSVGTEDSQQPIPSLVRIIPGMNLVKMKKGEIVQMNISTVPADNSDAVYAASNRTNVVKASVTGRRLTLTATGIGAATVTVSSGSVMSEIAVTVSGSSEAAVIKLDATSVSLDQTPGRSATVTAKVYDADGGLMDKEIDYWKADDDRIVNVIDLGGGRVKVEPMDAGSTYVNAYAGGVKAGFRVAVAEKQSAASGPSSIAMATPKLTLKKGESTVVGALYQPNGLADSAKGLEWSTSDPAVATVTRIGTGDRATISAVGSGSATIQASAISSRNVVATMSVTVPAPEQETEDVYTISLDRTNLRLSPSTDALVTATLRKNGEEVDASNVQWSFEGNTIGMAFIGANTLSQSYKGRIATVHANQNVGYAYITASYGTAVAKAQIEVADLSVVEDEGLRSVVISESTMLMEEGEYATFKAVVNPSVTGVRYVWTQTEEDGTTPAADPYVEMVSKSGGSLTIRAKKSGRFVLNLSAELEGFKAVTDSVSIEIVGKGASDAKYRYSAVKMDSTTLSLSQGSDASYIKATLVDTSRKDTEDPISKWSLLDERGAELLCWEDGKYIYKNQKFDSFSELKVYDASFTDVSDFSVIGSDSRMLRIVPGRAGIYFAEAYGPEEGPAETPFRVSARTMLDVGGAISGAMFQSSYMHLVKGSSTIVTVSRDPATAKVVDHNWIQSGDGVALPKAIGLSEQTVDSVLVSAESIGEEDLTYTATDVNGNVVSCRTHITVHDASWGTGGIRQIAFPSPFVTLGFPYASQSFKASAYYMDGTTASDAEINYTVQVSVDGQWEDVQSPSQIMVQVLCQSCNGAGEANGSPCTNCSGTGKVSKVVATYSEGLQNNDITIVPVAKGEFRVRATLQKDGQDYSSEMYVTIGGDSNNLTPSSSSIVLYTGGSASVSMSLDNPAYNAGFSVQILSEYTADGYLIENGRILATGEEMKEALKIANANENGVVESSDLVLGSRILVTNETTNRELTASMESLGLSTDDFIGLGLSDYTSRKFNRILETFPRRATVRVSTRDGQSSTDISVTIRRLPEGNTYPLSIRLSEDKVDLQPPFDEEQTITATLYDQMGKETAGTVQWYFYPVGATYTETDDDGKSRWDLDTAIRNEKENIDAYFNGKTMYYVPKKAGLYRLQVLCEQNPQLSYTSTISIAGDVKGLSTTTGQVLSVAKNSSAQVTAVFTPENALARKVFFAMDEKVAGTTAAHLIDADGVYTNAFVKVSVGGDTATVTGLAGTTGNDTQRLRVLYGKTTDDHVKLEQAAEEGLYVRLSGQDTFKVYDKDGNPTGETISAYYSIVNITVTVSKAIYTFSTGSDRSIDPSSLENGRISFDMLATASSEEGSVVSPFTHWDWVECRIVGEDSGLVYASSVPVCTVDGEAKSLYEKNGVWGWYDGSGTFHETADHSRYYNYEKETWQYRENTTTDDWHDIIFSNGRAYYVDGSHAKKQIEGVTYKALKADRDAYLTGNGNIRLIATPMGIATRTGDEAGALSVDNGGTSFFFRLNSDAISDETLRIVVRLRDDVKWDADSGYDAEMMDVKASYLALEIGGRIRNIYTGTVIRENHGSTVSETLVTNIEKIKLYEGASLTMIPSFNPTSTHEKGIRWEVRGVYQDGTAVPDNVLSEWVVYSSESDGDVSQLMLTAKSFGQYAENDHRTIFVTARSTSDQSISCTYEIDIQTLVKSLTFTSVGQIQTNKNVTSGVKSDPIYRNVSVDASPATEGAADIYCFDTTDVSGGGGNIDAYYITYAPAPDYGYDFSVEVVDNMLEGTSQVIGTVDRTGIGDDVRAFRFIPTGRIYSEYDDNGIGASGSDYTVSYGDVRMRIYNPQINFSKEFTIHYSPASFRLVRNLPQTDSGELLDTRKDGAFTYMPGQFDLDDVSADTRDAVQSQWDVLWDSQAKVLQSMEAVVLYDDATPSRYKDGKEKDEISLSFAGVTVATGRNALNDVVNRTVLQSYANPIGVARKDADGNYVNTESGEVIDRISVTWELLEAKGSGDRSSIVEFSNGDTILRTGDLGQGDNVATIRPCGGDGKAYLQYTIEYPLTDKDGKVVLVTKSVDGKTTTTVQKVKLTGGVPVYVVYGIDPELMNLVQASLSASGYPDVRTLNVSSLIPERISRAQKDRWYALSMNHAVTDSNGAALNGHSLYTGRMYATFLDTNGVYVGQRLTTGLNRVREILKGKDGITIGIGLTSIPSVDGALMPTDMFETKDIADVPKYLEGRDWTRKGYETIDLTDLAYLPWVTGLSVDMTKLSDPDAKDGSALGKLFKDGDLSMTHLESLDVKGRGEDSGLSGMKLPTAKKVDVTLRDFSFRSGDITGSLGDVSLDDVGFDGRIETVDGELRVKGKAGSLYSFKGNVTSLGLDGDGKVQLRGCTIGTRISGNTFGGELEIAGGSFSDPTATDISFKGGSIRSFLITGDCGGTLGDTRLASLDFSQCEDLSTFDTGGVYVSSLDLSESPSVGSYARTKWNTWKVKSFSMTQAGLAGAVEIWNAGVVSIDFSKNDNVTSLYVNKGSDGRNVSLMDLKASDCGISVADIGIRNASNARIDLSKNKLGTGNNSYHWETSDEAVEVEGRPQDEAEPRNPSFGAKYYTYSDIQGPVTKQRTCPTCNGDGFDDVDVESCTHCDGTGKVQGLVDCTKCKATGKVMVLNKCRTCNGYGINMNNCPDCNATGFQEDGKTPCETCSGKRYVQAPCRECNGAKQMEYEETCPDCKGLKKVLETPKTCPVCEGTTVVDHEGTVVLTFHDCAKCNGTGKVSYECYTATRTTHLFTYTNSLVIDGHSITLMYDGGMNRYSGLSKDFAQEWSGLYPKVNLSSNKICYKAGFAASTSYDAWAISMKVHFTVPAADERVAMLDIGSFVTDEYAWFNGEYNLNCYLNADGNRIATIPKHGYEPSFSYGAKLGSHNTSQFDLAMDYLFRSGSDRSATLVLYRDVNAHSNHWHDNKENARGAKIYVWPFGE